MYVHNTSIISQAAVAARRSNAVPAYKADPASLPPVVSWRLSLCLLHSCINILIQNKTLKVNYIKKFSLLNKSTLLITSVAVVKRRGVTSLFQYKNIVHWTVTLPRLGTEVKTLVNV